MRKIAVTGGVASGKTEVCRFMEELGAKVVAADSIVHRLLSPQTSVGQRVIRLLGPEVLLDGKLDREKVAEILFRDSDKLRHVEAIVHPAVYREIDREAAECDQPLFVAEVPLLYETGGEQFFDGVVAVLAPYELRKKRFQKELFDERQKRQLSDDEKAARADWVIVNEGDLSSLKAQVKDLYYKLIS